MAKVFFRDDTICEELAWSRAVIVFQRGLIIILAVALIGALLWG